MVSRLMKPNEVETLYPMFAVHRLPKKPHLQEVSMYFVEINNEWVNVTNPKHIAINTLINEVVIDGVPICQAANLGADVEIKEFVLALIDWVTSASKVHVHTPQEILAAYRAKQKRKTTVAKKKAAEEEPTEAPTEEPTAE